MSAIVVDLLDAVTTAIEDWKTNLSPWPSSSRWYTTNGFVLANFDVERTWLPYQRLEDMPEEGKVWIVGLSADDIGSESRSNVTRKEVPVIIAVQRRVDVTDKTTIDTMVEFEEQLREIIRKQVDPEQDQFSWLRTEALKDENETPYSFVGLREAGLFEAYFKAFFNTVLA